MTFWEALLTFLRAQKSGKEFTRKKMISNLSTGSAVPYTLFSYNDHYCSISTLDSYRNILTQAGYLNCVGRGIYKRVGRIPKKLSKGQVLREAYPTYDPRIW